MNNYIVTVNFCEDHTWTHDLLITHRILEEIDIAEEFRKTNRPDKDRRYFKCEFCSKIATVQYECEMIKRNASWISWRETLESDAIRVILRGERIMPGEVDKKMLRVLIDDKEYPNNKLILPVMGIYQN